MGKPGKPPFQPTKSQREEVMLLVATGMSEEAIAAAIGITRVTLRKRFADELLVGHSRIKAENFKRLERAARKGNVTAMKFLASQMDVLPPQAVKPEPLGKKETLVHEAQTAHERSGWGDILH